MFCCMCGEHISCSLPSTCPAADSLAFDDLLASFVSKMFTFFFTWFYFQRVFFSVWKASGIAAQPCEESVGMLGVGWGEQVDGTCHLCVYKSPPLCFIICVIQKMTDGDAERVKCFD